ncbi:hypothetical protein BJ912DRAFT_857101 [Pholiota molesta]|nr:hypothetical protein BJ912DRAFT_857101 [Pholiota molesta]
MPATHGFAYSNVNGPPSPAASGPTNIPSNYSSLHPANIFDVKGLVVVITGGGTGLGLMMAAALENNGATVYIVGRRAEVLERAAKENNKFGRIIPIQGDITNRDDLLAIVEVVRNRHGYVDLLVNNAAIARNLYPHPLPSPEYGQDMSQPISPPASPKSEPSIPSIKAFQSVLWNTGSVEEFADTFATNVTATYYTTIAHLRPPHHTSQVLSVSSSGSFRLDSQVLSPSYTLSKGACTQLGKLLANLLAPWGIRSNVLAPGVWPTDMTTHPTPGFALDPFALADSVPLRRTGTQEDMAGTILFLASRAGAYVNGAVWLVDGGRVGTVASSY